MAKLKIGQEVDVHNGTMETEGFEGRGTLVEYRRTEFGNAIGGKFNGKRVEFEYWKVQMANGDVKTRCFIVEGLKPQLNRDDIQKLVLEQGLQITDLIDVFCDLKGLVGVGFISLGDDLKNYCYAKAHKRT